MELKDIQIGMKINVKKIMRIINNIINDNENNFNNNNTIEFESNITRNIKI